MPEHVINIIGMPGSGKTETVNWAQATYGLGVYHPSQTIRRYAAERGIVLTGRTDYNAVHIRMVEEDPEIMIRPILEHDAATVAIDGLRVLRHTTLLKERLGDRFRTAALDCPTRVRIARILAAEEFRQHRDNSNIRSFDDALRDEASENNPGDPYAPNVWQVMAQHDVSDSPIDSNRPFAVVTAELSVLLRPFVTG